MTPTLLQKKPIRRLIKATSKVLNKAIEPFISNKMPQAMAEKLQEDVFIFSGFKTYHQLKEASENLRDKNGNFKSFEQFYKDTEKIRTKYNKQWLKAEYNYARRSSEMAVKWVEIEKDKEDIDLVYQTIGDARVRDSHRVLDEICLPASHPFWDTAFPPNGWNCRCFIREEEKGTRPYTKTDGLEEIFNKSTPEHFRFNPGKEQTIFPKKHPYYGKRGYGHCSIGKLASHLNKNEECKIFSQLYTQIKSDKDGYKTIKTKKGNTFKAHKNADLTEIDDNIRSAKVLVDEFPEKDIRIREHVRIDGVKNPEYLIDGVLADAKRIMSYKGIADAFRKGIEQKAQIIILDFDKHLRNQNILCRKVAKAISNREKDFLNNSVIGVYIIHNKKAIEIPLDKTYNIEWMTNEISKKGL